MLSKLDEIRLLSQCALADNRDAFGRLVEAYQPRVRRFLLNLTTGDEMLTDDRVFRLLALGCTASPTTSSITTCAATRKSMSRTSRVWPR